MKSESEVAQPCPTLCNAMDCSLPGFSVHGILQARILEWVTISFSRGSSLPKDWTWVSHIGGRCFTTREQQTDVFPSGLLAKPLCSRYKGPWVRSLVRELDPTCHNWRFHVSQLRLSAAKKCFLNNINKIKATDLRIDLEERCYIHDNESSQYRDGFGNQKCKPLGKNRCTIICLPDILSWGVLFPGWRPKRKLSS